MSVVMVPDKCLQHSISLLLRDSGRQVLVGQVIEVVVANDANHRIVRPGKTSNGTSNLDTDSLRNFDSTKNLSI